MKKNTISKDRIQSIKYFIIKLSYFIFSISKKSIFVSMLNRNNITGPGRFLFNLEQGFKQYNLKIERRFLSKCNSALIISSAPAHFYDFCNKKGIKTILRIDGFSLPNLYNNRERYQNCRILTYDRIKTNQDMQIGLLKSNYVIFQSHFSKLMSSKYLYNRINNYSIIYNGVNINHMLKMTLYNIKVIIIN